MAIVSSVPSTTACLTIYTGNFAISSAIFYFCMVEAEEWTSAGGMSAVTQSDGKIHNKLTIPLVHMIYDKKSH